MKALKEKIPWDSVGDICAKALLNDDFAAQIAFSMRIALLAERADACGPVLSDPLRFEQTMEDILAQADLIDNTALMVSLSITAITFTTFYCSKQVSISSTSLIFKFTCVSLVSFPHVILPHYFSTILDSRPLLWLLKL